MEMASSEEWLERQLCANETKWRQLQDFYANEIGRHDPAPPTKRILFQDDDPDLQLRRDFEDALKPIRTGPASVALSVSESAMATVRDPLDDWWLANDQFRPDSDDLIDILNNLRILAGQLPITIRLFNRAA